MIELNNFKNLKDVIVVFASKLVFLPKNYTQKSIEVLKRWENSRIDDLVWTIWDHIVSKCMTILKMANSFRNKL